MTHGSETAYWNGCRCDECKAASATARRLRRARPSVKVHGAVGHRNGCRCAICVAGIREYRRERRARGLRS